MATPLIYEKKDGIAYITLNRPAGAQRADAGAGVPPGRCDRRITLATIRLRVAIITGAGDKAFCAGGDLGTMIPLLTGARAPKDDWDRRVLTEPVVMAASSLRDFDSTSR